MENKEQDEDNIEAFSLSEKIRCLILLKDRIDIDSLNFIDYLEEEEVNDYE